MSRIPLTTRLRRLVPAALLLCNPAPGLDWSTAVDRIAPGPGVGKATLLPAAGKGAINLPCDLSRVKDRCYWDIPVDWDLRIARGVRLRLRCPDTTPVSQFNLYLRANGVWHAAGLPVRAGAWRTVFVSKAAMRPEGASRGWGRVDMLRVGVWKGGSGVTSLQVSELTPIDATDGIGILRCGTGLGNAVRNESCRNTARIASALDSYGIHPAIIDDSDWVQARIRDRFTVLIIPFLPRGLPHVAPALLSFIRGGGRLLGFYECPAPLAAAMGFEPGSYLRASRVPGGFAAMGFDSARVPGAPERVRQRSGNIVTLKPLPGRGHTIGWWLDSEGRRTRYRAAVLAAQGIWLSHVYLGQDPAHGPRLIAALTAALQPGLWDRAAEMRVREISYSLGFPSFREAERALSAPYGGLRAVGSALDRARGFYRAAGKLLESGQPIPAIDFAAKSKRALEEACIATRRAPAGEFRGVWCHRGYGIEGWSWDQTVRRLRASGFNALFANMATAASAYYPSRILQPTRRNDAGVDRLQECLAACQRHGVSLHVWKLCFSLGQDARTALRDRLGKAGRLQRSRDGKQLPWLCPSHPENIRAEVLAAEEITRNYAVQGLHLDFIRYPGSEACFCASCRAAFERFLGRRLAQWPGDVSTTGRLAEPWLEFRRSTVTRVVKDIRTAVKRVRPGMVLSAAVFGNWLTARDTVGQDWVNWCRAGLLDAVLPMNYVDHAEDLEQAVSRQQLLLRGSTTRLYPGIGLSARQLDTMETLRQIDVTRRRRCGGFCVFEYNEKEARGVLSELSPALTP